MIKIIPTGLSGNDTDFIMYSFLLYGLNLRQEYGWGYIIAISPVFQPNIYTDTHLNHSYKCIESLYMYMLFQRKVIQIILNTEFSFVQQVLPQENSHMLYILKSVSFIYEIKD